MAASQSRAFHVVAARQQGAAVGAERHGLDRALDAGGVAESGVPSAEFQSRAVLSALPVSDERPSGLNATALT